MARDFVKIDRTTTTATHAQLLLQYVDAVRRAFDLSKRVVGIMAHNNDGTNYADVEALFGIPAGSGQLVVTLATDAVRDADAKALTERVG